jgi:hypothetical protein
MRRWPMSGQPVSAVGFRNEDRRLAQDPVSVYPAGLPATPLDNHSFRPRSELSLQLMASAWGRNPLL